MEASASLKIAAPVGRVWKIVTDIEKFKDRISCIKGIEILEKPADGLVGFKWREIREMFGREAEETMWIKEAVEHQYYVAEAKNSGCIYHSRVSLIEEGGVTEVSMSFKSIPQTFMAKLMSPIMYLMKGTIKKAYEKDLKDIEKVVMKSQAS